MLKCLFDFFVNRHALEDGIVLLQLKTFGSILTVLGSDVTRSAGHAAGLVLGAFEDDLDAITFSFLLP